MKTMLRILTIIFSLLIVYSAVHIVLRQVNIKENNNIKEQIKEYVKPTTIESNRRLKYIVDFDELKKVNPDVVGYIKVPNSNIDYAVVKANDNEYYLDHNLNKKWSKAGWIFADYKNKIDGTDLNIVIYGHKMKDGSMFGTLKDSLNDSWYLNPDNQEIIFVTEEDTYYYQIFSIYSIEPEMYYIKTEFKENEYIDFLNTIKSRSIYNFNVELDENDRVLTLSSCLDSYNQKRVAVHAKLIKE